ncbi:MAG: hypothetical protein SVV03_02660 [Candidatus Nanohaloarchaea archaeon]|nr:hypothetical protein [Candidatus Nanohaloarchaea archaeon]
MVQIGFDNQEPIRVDLGHESRHKGTIANVGEVREVDEYQGDGKKEQIRIDVRSEIDDLDISDEDKEALQEYLEEENERRDEDVPTDKIELPFFLTAKITRGASSEYSNSKLYDTLKKLGLAEPSGDTDVVLKDRHGEEVSPVDPEDSNEQQNKDFANYLRENLVGMRIEYEVRNSNRDNPEKDEYSTVAKVVNLEEDPEAEE